MAPSSIDLTLADGKQVYSQAKVTRSKRNRINEVIEAPMYRQASFAFKGNQLDLKLQNGFGLIVLATDEGVAYRFYQTNKSATTIYNEVADYQFGADRTAWLAYSTNKEKPMAMAAEEAEELARLGASYPRLFIRHNRRWEAKFTQVNDIINSGILGDVFEVKLTRNSFQVRNDWQTISEFGGGQLLNWGPHIVDHSLRFCGGRCNVVYSDIQQIFYVRRDTKSPQMLTPQRSYIPKPIRLCHR